MALKKIILAFLLVLACAEAEQPWKFSLDRCLPAPSGPPGPFRRYLDPSDVRTPYLVLEEGEEDCETVLENEEREVQLGRPIKDLCKNEVTEVRFCAVSPRLLFKLASGGLGGLDQGIGRRFFRGNHDNDDDDNQDDSFEGRRRDRFFRRNLRIGQDFENRRFQPGDIMDQLSQLTDEQLLEIPRTEEYYRGLCVQCPVDDDEGEA